MATRDDILEGIEWLGHAGFRIKTRGGVVYVDPWRTSRSADADVILVTHDHFDHFSRDDVVRLARPGTVLVAPPSVTEQVKGPARAIAPGESLELPNLTVSAVAAYNTNKLDSEGRPFHPHGAACVGYVLNDGRRTIYHSGDTDVIPEMDEATGVDVALLPVSGTYVMTAVEAAEAARRIDPGLAVPMHWGALIGSEDDANEFAREAPVEVRILERAG